MAKTALQVAIAITAISCMIAMLTTWALTWHTLRLYAAQGFLGTLFEVDTFLLRAHVTAGTACSLVKTVFRNDLCDMLTGAKDLQGLASAFCTPAVQAVVPTLCPGYQAASIGGIVVFLSIMLMFGFFGTAAWLMQRYLIEPKKKYREISFILQISGATVHTGAITFYSIFVMMNLEGVRGANGLLSAAISPDESLGVSWGCWMSWVCFILNVVSIILFANSKLKEEEQYLEMKRQKEFEEEQAPQNQPAQNNDPYAYGAGMFSGYAPTSPPYDPNAYGGGYAGAAPVGYTVQIDVGGGMPLGSAQGVAPGMMPPPSSGSDFGIASGPHPA
mmetsp:Transcript_4351/g.10671  ORF Transcript_4351/g.10671 Transcript_4351/m.10671 type:complete len:331 (-) Transcript_4351:22-1014(-)